MIVCIRIVDIIPEDVVFMRMELMDPNWFVARLTYLREIYAVVKRETSTIDFIFWCNRKVVRIMTVDIEDGDFETVCVHCTYEFFIDHLAFDTYYDLENCELLLAHLLQDVDE